MFISQIVRNAETNKRIMITFFFERIELLWEFEEDDEKKVTRITKLVEKFDTLNDGRLPDKENHVYIKLSKLEYDKIISELGVSYYGNFELHTTLKYKTIEFADDVFAEESITLPGFDESIME